MELEKPWITELHVRMDCTGCVHKIKRTLHGVEGVHDIQFDFPQQMITVIGRANPEKLVKAIKKTRKIATICSHKENPENETNTEATPEVPPPESEPPAVETNPPVEEPTKEDPPAPEEKPEPPPQPDQEEEVEEIPMVHHYPHHRSLNLWNNDENLNYDQVVPYYYATATHSYNNYYPSPSLSSYATIVSPPQNYHYTSDYYHNHHHQQQQQQQQHYERGGSDGNNNNISSMFSDENPNACTIV